MCLKEEWLQQNNFTGLKKGSKRNGWEANEAQEMSKEKLVFKSGGIVQSLSEIQTINEIDPETGEKKYKFSQEEMAIKEHEKFGSTYDRRSWTFRGKNGGYSSFGRQCKTN